MCFAYACWVQINTRLKMTTSAAKDPIFVITSLHNTWYLCFSRHSKTHRHRSTKGCIKTFKGIQTNGGNRDREGESEITSHVVFLADTRSTCMGDPLKWSWQQNNLGLWLCLSIMSSYLSTYLFLYLGVVVIVVVVVVVVIGMGTGMNGSDLKEE